MAPPEAFIPRASVSVNTDRRTKVKRLPGMSRGTLAALVVVSTFSACNSGEHHDTGLAVSVDGQWEGTWAPTSLAPSGVVTLQLEQTGTSVTGTATLTEHPCVAMWDVACQMNGHEISGWFHAGSFHMSFSGSCPESSHCSGAHHANVLTASYEILDGPCAGESGAMQLTPVAAYGSDATEGRAVHVGDVILIDPDDASVVRFPVFEQPEAPR